MNKILIRFDDVCPTMDWIQWQRAVEILNKYKVKPLLGIVPECKDPILHINPTRVDFWEYIKTLEKQGWTLAMHGYQHNYDKVSKGLITPRGNTEFAGHPYSVQYEKIKHGKAILESHGIFTDIFFAPSHSYDDNTLKALSANGFKYISDGKTTKPILRYGIICLPCRSSGMPKIKTGSKYYTAVFHAHEWTRPDKAADFQYLSGLCAAHTKEITDFNTYKQQLRGNLFLQRILEKIYMVWEYNCKPILSKLKYMLFPKKTEIKTPNKGIKSSVRKVISNTAYNKINPAISIITPIYNRSHTIISSLRSLEKQTYKNFECILIDDGSTDDIDKVIIPFINSNTLPILYIKKENGGVHTARNIGIKYIRGDMTLLLDSDDEIIPQTLEILLNTWNNIPDDKKSEYNVICAQCMDENGMRIGKPFPNHINDVPWQEAIKLCDNTKGEHVSLQVSAILKANTWPEPENITLVAEDIVWKKLEKKYKSYFINDMLRIYHRDSGNSYTYQPKKNLQYYINAQWNDCYYLNHWQIYKSNKISFFNIFIKNEVFTIVLKKYQKKYSKFDYWYLKFLYVIMFIPCYILALYIIKRKLED